MAIEEFDKQAKAMRGLLGDVGVTSGDYDSARRARYEKASALQAPQHYASAMREEMGLGKFLGQAFFGEMHGPLGAMFAPDYVERKNQYKADLLSYADQKTELQKLARMRGDIDLLNNNIDEKEDAYARASMLGMPGIGSPEDVSWVLKGGEPKVKPSYQVVNSSNGKYLFDTANPNSRGIPMLTPDGKPIRESLPQHTVDRIGAYDRMVPRLMELNEMEVNGMKIPRAAMTQLRAYEEADGSGNRVVTAKMWEKWLEENLTDAQRQYILAAEDAGMVVLRDESGAAISSGEILRQMNQYIVFDDLNDETITNQRNARARKARSLSIDFPDYITKDRQDHIDYLNDFDGRIAPYPVPTREAIKYLIDNPDVEDMFVKKYGKNALPEGF